MTPEHLLLALLRERQGVAAMTLAALGVDLDGMQRELQQWLSRSASEEPPTAERQP